MSKVYIFGDSFFIINTQTKFAWIKRLSENYEVVNCAFGGAGNHEIFSRFLSCMNVITKDDIIILGWSDPGRFYVNPNIIKTDKIRKMHYKNFYNKDLDLIQQEAYMVKIKKIIEQKQLRVLFLWSFPTDYLKIEKENVNWLDAVIYNTDPSDYFYQTDFENEVRPALIYFSKKELNYMMSHNQVTRAFTNDTRPNHIANESVHNMLYDIASQFIEGKINGKIDLLERMKNG